MAEYLIQESTLRGIAEAIKTKTGSTEPIAVTDMASQIGLITGGGGGDYTVTFMNEDGSKVLYEKHVMEHDTCANPVTLELIDTPTKESTAEFNYTFSGWSLAPGGEIDANALQNITEDKILYAAFVGVVRLYSIKYYDGDTLIHSEILAYGMTPTYVPEDKNGYTFIGWDPAVSPVIGEASYYAKWQLGTIEGTCGEGVTWTIQDAVLTISGAGDMYDYTASNKAPWTEFNSLFNSVVFSDGVTRIGAYAFYGCSNITSITLVKSVESMGTYAFYNCTGLKSIILTDSSIADIPNYAFYGCTALTNCTAPYTQILSVGEQAFYNCTALKTPGFSGAVTIGKYAFYNCTTITNAGVGSNCESIGNHAFDGCSKLNYASIGDAMKRIGQYAFSNCSALNNVYVSNRSGWKVSSNSTGTSPTNVSFSESDVAGNAKKFTTTYVSKYWFHS